MKYGVMVLLWCVSALAYSDSLLRVESPRVRETLPAQSVSSAYFTVVNDSAEDRELVAASSDRSPRVEIHEHRHDNGMMQMRKLESVSVSAGGQRVFETGGLHLMLLDLPQPLKAGESVSVILRFADGSELSVLFPVQTLQQTLQTPDHSHHHHH